VSAEIAHNLTEYRLRSKLPQYFRYAALAAMAVTIIVVAAGIYRERSKSAFRLKSEHTQLSTDVVAEVNGYERTESDGGVAKYHITADHAKTFSDDHQELSNVNIEIYGVDGAASDKMAAADALYIPDKDKSFTAYLKGDVRIHTRDDLKVRTEQIVYTRSTEMAEAEDKVEFERDAIRGNAIGAIARIGERRLDLLKDVNIDISESPELASSGIRYARFGSGSASYDQDANRIELRDAVDAKLVSKGRLNGSTRETNVRAGRAVVSLDQKTSGSPQFRTLEMFDGVRINSADSGQPPTDIESGYALYEKPADRYTLTSGAHIVTVSQNQSTDARAAEIVYEQSLGRLQLTGSVEIQQGTDLVKGDVVSAELFPDNKIKSAVARGNAFASQTTTERTTKISAPELNAAFNDQKQLTDANAVGESTVEIIENNHREYSTVAMSAAKGIGVMFKGSGLIASMRTDGRTTIQLNAPDSGPGSANKRVTADVVRTVFAANGRDLQKAEAIGDAELSVDPLHAAPNNYRTAINAPRFDCEFFQSGNNVRSCTGGKKARVSRVPTVTREGRGTQNMVTDQITAQFNAGTHDIDRLEAAGSSKFTELDRNAIAAQFTYTQSDEIVRLRGGEPTAWDSGARAKAREIDWDTRNNRTSLRGSVGTTYYSQKQMRGSAPFGSPDKPVFLTADNAEMDHAGETATYTSNARGWQGENYVRGDKIVIDQRGGKFLADGNVHSLLYNARLKQNGKDTTLPTSASAASMAYDRDTRVLRYRTAVDIRQGTDRITAGAADIFLNDQNEVAKTIAETDVVITQPSRRASGTWAQYTTADEVAILRGNPATVTDAVNGSSQSGEITVHMRDNRVLSSGKSTQNSPGRSRSVYKVRPGQ
jgi:LPS export ABC transporter protein LptC